jgi:hypothetical protein
MWTLRNVFEGCEDTAYSVAWEADPVEVLVLYACPRLKFEAQRVLSLYTELRRGM